MFSTRLRSSTLWAVSVCVCAATWWYLLSRIRSHAHSLNLHTTCGTHERGRKRAEGVGRSLHQTDDINTDWRKGRLHKFAERRALNTSWTNTFVIPNKPKNLGCFDKHKSYRKHFTSNIYTFYSWHKSHIHTLTHTYTYTNTKHKDNTYCLLKMETPKQVPEKDQELANEYLSSLVDLNYNSKPLIDMLTILAQENLEHGLVIVNAIEQHISKVIFCLFIFPQIVSTPVTKTGWGAKRLSSFWRLIDFDPHGLCGCKKLDFDCDILRLW